MKNLKAVDIDGVHHDIRPSELSWRPSVYGVVIKDGNILLSPQHGKGYDLPGGGMDMDESFERTVVREVKEETGIDVRPIRQLHCRDSLFVWKPDEPSQRIAMHSIMVYYLCEMIGGELSIDGFDEEEVMYAELAEWLPLDRLDNIGVASSYDWREIIYKLS